MKQRFQPFSLAAEVNVMLHCQKTSAFTAFFAECFLLIASFCAFPVAAAADELTPREQAFTQQMENCVLVGTFTVDGQNDSDPLKPERYEIESAVKASGDLWVFTVRIKYGKLDTKLPVTVPLLWAGETPMVSLTNASIPGLGEGFSARVLFHEDRYAGTWQHGKVGGHMFGRIEKAKAAAPGEKKTQTDSTNKQGSDK